MDAREITQQDLGTSAQVTGDAQMLFLQRYVSLRASHLNCFSAVSWKPLLKCFQEPGIEFYQQLHMDPATCLICSSSPLRNPTFTVKCGVFTTVLSDSPRGKCLALPAAVRPLFFFQLLFLAGKDRSIQFLPTREKYETWSQLGVPVLPGEESLTSFTASTMQLSIISNGFCLLILGF